MHADSFLTETAVLADEIDREMIEKIAQELDAVRKRGGRLFILGLGGSAANASHAAADFRRLCEIEAYTPTDNVAEFSARVNDDGWPHAFAWWLKAASAGRKDAILVLSVGGGTEQVSQPITYAVRYAKQRGAKIIGVVGPNGGVTAEEGDIVLKVPCMSAAHVTPQTEAFQAVVWHCLVSHPLLQKNKTKW